MARTACRSWDDRCLKQRGQCRRPNGWIEHMVRSGGKGMTRAAIRASYNPLVRPRKKCKYVRNRGKSHFRDLAAIANVCAWANNIANRPRHNTNRAVVRRKIMRDMIGRKPGQFRNRNPPAAMITPMRLRKLYRSIDKHYCDGSFRTKLNASTTQRPALELESVAGFYSANPQTQAVTVRYTDYRNGSKFCTIEVYRGDWDSAGVRNRRTDGIRGVGSKLEMLIIAICHELTHVLIHISCGPGIDDHGDTFKRLNNILWGHNIDSHEYDDHWDEDSYGGSGIIVL